MQGDPHRIKGSDLDHIVPGIRQQGIRFTISIFLPDMILYIIAVYGLLPVTVSNNPVLIAFIVFFIGVCTGSQKQKKNEGWVK